MRGLSRRALIGSLLAATALPATGAEPLVVTDAAGVRTPLAALVGGGPRVLHLWATWCAPCLAELPDLARTLDDNPDLAQHIVIVSVDSAPFETVAAFLDERLGIALPTRKIAAGNPGLVYAIRGYPVTLFIGADGTVKDRVTGPLDWSAADTLERVRAHVGAAR